jgi:hypothetical protein
MASLHSRIRIILLVALGLAMAPAVARAQNSVPVQEGNTWDWRHHEPQPSEVRRDEKATGIAPPSAQQQKADDEVESIYRQLLRNEPLRQP